MKIWLGYLCGHNGYDFFRKVDSAFFEKEKALLWVKDSNFEASPASEHEWREYEEREIE